MINFKRNKEWFLTTVIIAFSLAGIIYFGLQAISDVFHKSQENPFEYNIEHFKQSEASLLHYTQIRWIDVALNRLYGLALGNDDRIYISGDEAMLVIEQDGKIISNINCGDPVRALAIDDNGDMYLAKTEHVEVYDSIGSLKNSWESLGPKALLTSIAVNPNFVYIADAGNHIVWKLTKNGKFQERIGAQDELLEIPGFIIPSPYFDVAIDPDGFLWVVNPGRHSLENYNDNGDLRSYWGKPSMTIEGFCGCCNPTHIAILQDGSFVTSEKGIARVKVYNRLGQLVSLVAGPDQFIEGTEGLDLAADSRGQIYILDPKQKSVRIFKKKDEIMASKIGALNNPCINCFTGNQCVLAKDQCFSQ
jgi:hypothetical protein